MAIKVNCVTICLVCIDKFVYVTFYLPKWNYFYYQHVKICVWVLPVWRVSCISWSIIQENISQHCEVRPTISQAPGHQTSPWHYHNFLSGNFSVRLFFQRLHEFSSNCVVMNGSAANTTWYTLDFLMIFYLRHQEVTLSSLWPSYYVLWLYVSWKL